jgi:hypothetical protein
LRDLRLWKQQPASAENHAQESKKKGRKALKISRIQSKKNTTKEKG